MSVRAVALLRGVNVGGVRFRMADLAAALEQRGFAGVRTVLASGNVVLTAERDDPTATAAAVSAVIRERFGFDVAVIVVGLEAVRAAIAEHPFPRSADRHAYVVFAGSDEVLADLMALAGGVGGADDGADEQVRPGTGVVHWSVAKGRTLDSPFGARYGRWQRSGVVTTRNLATLEKVVAAG